MEEDRTKWQNFAHLYNTLPPHRIGHITIFCENRTPIFQKEGPALLSPPRDLYPEKPKVTFHQPTSMHLVDCRQYFLNINERAENQYSLLNIIYLLTYCTTFRIVMVFTNDDTTDPRKETIIRAINRLASIFFRHVSDDSTLSGLISRFADSIAFSVEDAQSDINITAYLNRFREISNSSALPSDNNHLIRKMLANIFHNQRVFLHNDPQVITNIASNVAAMTFTVPEFRHLLACSLREDQLATIQQMEEDLIDRESNFLDEIKENIRNKILFTREHYLDRIMGPCFDLPEIIAQNTAMSDKNTINLVVALLLFHKLTQYLGRMDEKISETYSGTLFGQTLKIIGGYNFFSAFPKTMNAGKFINDLKQIFIRFPKSQIQEIDRSQISQKITVCLMRELIDLIVENFQDLYREILQQQSGRTVIQTLTKIMDGLSLTITACQQIIHRPIDLLKDLKDLLENNISFLKKKLTEIKFYYYKRMKRNLTEQETVTLLLQLEHDLRGCYEYISSEYQALTYEILKEVYRVLGDKCLHRRKFHQAEKLFEFGMLYDRLKNVEVNWLSEIYRRGSEGDDIDPESVKKRTRVLLSLGFEEEARRWIFKFKEVFNYEKANEMVDELKQIATLGKKEHENFLEDMSSRMEKIQLIDMSILRSVEDLLRY